MKELFFCFILIFPSLVSAETLNKSFKIAQRTFDVPENWTAQTPSSRMRKAQYKNGKTEIVVFYFGAGSGGSVEANINRWLGQFNEPKEKLSAKGTYMSGPPLGQKVPMANYAMRGAIIECKGGPIFIKMTGPVDEVTKSAADFDKTARSGL